MMCLCMCVFVCMYIYIYIYSPLVSLYNCATRFLIPKPVSWFV